MVVNCDKCGKIINSEDEYLYDLPDSEHTPYYCSEDCYFGGPPLSIWAAYVVLFFGFIGLIGLLMLIWQVFR